MRTWLLGGLTAVALAGCDHVQDCCEGDARAPEPPRGLISRTGDRQVDLCWTPNDEQDLSGYFVWRSDGGSRFSRVATLRWDAEGFIDRGLENGRTYSYAISAFDEYGNESELSGREVRDTPRAEGFDLRLCNARLCGEDAGFDFSRMKVVDATDANADIYFWSSPEDGAWMVTTERSATVYTDIQDAGYRTLDSIDRAPIDGWTPRGEAALIEGHSYVVWTWDDHYAKFRVLDVSGGRVLLDWAYQEARANPELRQPAGAETFDDSPVVRRVEPRAPHALGLHTEGGER